MDIQLLKEYIYENNKVELILQEIGCHHIKYHPQGNPDPYWSCANYDGDNINGINLYNKVNLKCINYTRDMTNGKDISTDLISLVCFSKKLTLFDGIKFICSILGIDYYYDFEEDIPESIKITKLIYELQSNINEDDDSRPLKPISEKILTYYKPYVNDMFLNDGISYESQVDFEIKYDEYTNRVVIPIRDEIGSLVGIKGRLFKNNLEEWESKYLYIEPCARNKILFGLDKTYEYIKSEGKCLICESEKGVIQLWSMGYKYCIGTGGTKISKQQIDKLSRLGIDLIFAFDQDVKKKEIETISERFMSGVNIYAIYDEENILNKKESPMDNKTKFDYLYKNCLYKIK